MAWREQEPERKLERRIEQTRPRRLGGRARYHVTERH